MQAVYGCNKVKLPDEKRKKVMETQKLFTDLVIFKKLYKMLQLKYDNGVLKVRFSTH